LILLELLGTNGVFTKNTSQARVGSLSPSARGYPSGFVFFFFCQSRRASTPLETPAQKFVSSEFIGAASPLPPDNAWLLCSRTVSPSPAQTRFCVFCPHRKPLSLIPSSIGQMGLLPKFRSPHVGADSQVVFHGRHAFPRLRMKLCGGTLRNIIFNGPLGSPPPSL